MHTPNKEKQTNNKRIFNQYKNYDELDINEVSSILLEQYEIIGGRKFLKTDEANNFMPSDEMELRRMDIMHVLTRYSWKGNFSAPVEEILKNGKATVLDAGCGTGCWVLDLGHDFPNSTFVGVDIQPCGFPSVNQRSPNIGFLEYNLLNGIPFPDKTFDYVHMASMWTALTKQQYMNVIHELVRVTKNNGWIEIYEANFNLKNLGNYMKVVQDAFHTKLKQNGFDPMIFLEISKCLKSINELTNIEHKKLDVSIGGWAGRYGEFVLESVKQFYGSATYMPDYMGISQNEYQKLIDGFDKQCNQNQSSLDIHRFIAKKVNLSETQ
ncbi:S-adenosyl-L-methionine-dependent methyltransferase [Gigaspora rosea]|uniref:S-adenosyl-L-methionine-dependent methyltransferase n=1 Tax=Gigaspora rosea TaxID=44941 RepID=A0A397UQN3_9GLOM|nr:S-adenosyl-L-methionine-dependent methyltransferase [Gigaspora rosea]CAG8717708.1 25349_t:CDS:2 [Gigaspora rosea]